MVKREKPDFQLLLTDVVMPKMDGHIFVRRLKPILPDIKIVFMSGYTEDTLLKKGELNRDIEFVQKPFNLVDLARRIRKVLDN
jgi:CheY-like chemotaxis protein